MSSYTRKPITVTAHCPICPWIRTYFQNDNPKADIKVIAAHGQAAHILADHPVNSAALKELLAAGTIQRIVGAGIGSRFRYFAAKNLAVR